MSLLNIPTDGNGLEEFLQICINTLDQSAPRKMKYVRGNNMSFFNRALSSAQKKEDS